MAAERHLDLRREPAKPVVSALGHEKGRLGEVVFVGDRLHCAVRRERLHQHDGSRIAGEPPCRERIELEDANLHVLTLDQKGAHRIIRPLSAGEVPAAAAVAKTFPAPLGHENRVLELDEAARGMCHRRLDGNHHAGLERSILVVA